MLLHGDCLEKLKEIADNSVDAVVTDPPYGLSFMGKKWDYDVPSEDIWRECLRVLKPGGHLLAFAGTRTQHRMAVRIEDAGFEIRDMIAWVYGSGFPKSLDVSKAIDKAAGAEREVVGKMSDIHPRYKTPRGGKEGDGNIISSQEDPPITAPATEAAKQWQGWGTALKPALEPITVARKPFSGTVAANVLAHGTGALNVDGCRVEFGDGPKGVWCATQNSTSPFIANTGTPTVQNPAGRWPANLIHDGSEEVLELFPVTKTGDIKVGTYKHGKVRNVAYGEYGPRPDAQHKGDTGSAARFFKRITMDDVCNDCIMLRGCSQRIWRECAKDRQPQECDFEVTALREGKTVKQTINVPLEWDEEFASFVIGDNGQAVIDAARMALSQGVAPPIYYCAKASKRDRDAGCDGLALKPSYMVENGSKTAAAANGIRYERSTVQRNNHPTVKPTDLMRYLVRLVTPPGGVVLDPFCGSGSTGKACALEGFSFIGIEREAEYVEIAKARVAAAQKEKDSFLI